MSGLLALLDDVAAIAKVAATSVDDVLGQAAKAGAKAAGAVIDDAAVTPKYVHGFSADRELPIVWKIARGSLFNKFVVLLPIALLLSSYAPWAIAPLLMLGGAYLCYEGAEKVWHVVNPSDHYDEDLYREKLSDAHLEEQKVKGAIKTDFILSAEIMTIALSALPESGFWMELASLAVIALGITAMVYGGVALIVKADDGGIHLAANGRLAATRQLGRWIVRAMPGFLKLLMTVGTAAMLWVGGSIIVHGLAELGWHGPEHVIESWSEAVAYAAGTAEDFLKWLTKATVDGLLGLALGFVLIPLSSHVISPIIGLFARRA